MSNKYLQLREKYRRFNNWEIAYNKKIPVERHLDRFVKLYEAGQLLDKQIIEKCHQKHLEALIEMQKRLKRARKGSV